MAKFDDKVNGDTVDASEYNNVVRAFRNSIEDSGQTIDGTNTQMSKALANYSAVSTYYTDSGIADAYVLNTINNLESPDSYYDGMEVRFRAGNPNTGACTVNVNSLGVVDIKQNDGTTDLAAGQIGIAKDTVLRYDNANSAFVLAVIGQASETVAGIAEIATQAETNTGTDDAKIITPLKLASSPYAAKWVFLSSSTASGSTSVDITLDTSTYDSFVIIAKDIYHGTDNTEVWARLSNNGGSSFRSGASDYSWNFQGRHSAGGQDGTGNAASQIELSAGDVSNIQAEAVSFKLWITSASSTSVYTKLSWDLVGRDNDSSTATFISNGGATLQVATEDNDAIQFLASSGTITGGTYILYGIKES